MSLVRVIGFLAAALGAGTALALTSLMLGVPTGWIGAAGLIGWAVAARRRWARQEATSGLEPGAPERILWLRLAGVALVLGHLAAAILLVQGDLRVGHGNSLAIDSWTMVAAIQIAALLFRRDSRERDERHDAIAAHGVRVGYAALIGLLLVLIPWLGLTPEGLRAPLTDFVLANLLIAVLLTSYAAMLLAQLIAYAKDTRRAEAEHSL
jgi:hypothetical protein